MASNDSLHSQEREYVYETSCTPLWVELPGFEDWLVRLVVTGNGAAFCSHHTRVQNPGAAKYASDVAQVRHSF